MFNAIAIIRRLALLGLAGLAMACSGCATMYTLNQPNTFVKQKPSNVALTDTIVGIGKPDAQFAEQIRNRSSLLLLGKAYSYLLLDGAAPLLLRMSQELDNSKITLDNGDDLYMRDHKVWGFLTVHYRVDDAHPPAAKEQDALRQMGFTQVTLEEYRLRVEIAGAVYPAMNLASAANPLSTHYDLVFHSPPTQVETPNLGKYALLPVAVVFDVVMSPVELVLGGLGIYMLGHANMH